MSDTITPPEIDDEVLSLCRDVVSDEEPKYVPVRSESWAKLDECFNNIEEKVKRDNGERVLGWGIWLRPTVLVEAEFHSVWKSPAGREPDLQHQIHLVR